MTPLLLALTMGSASVDVAGVLGVGAAKAQTQRQGSMQLMLRRQPKALEVVLEGVGEKPELQQRLNGLVWEARLLTKGKPGLLRGPQRLSVPELGIDTVSLNGGGNSYRIVVSAADGQSIADPVVSSDGRNLILTFSGLGTPQRQTGRLDLNTPGRVPQRRYAPPLRARAVAPPLGDMAVGTMVLQNRSFVNVSGPPVTLTLNNAPAKDALMSMARLGGYGFVYMDDSSQVSSDPSTAASTVGRPVTMSFVNQSYSKALNSLLLASGLQGKLDGRTLLIGTAVSGKTFGPQISKVYRLNQATAASAADYLASLGAQISKINTTSITTGEPSSSGTAQISNQTSQTKSTLTNVETYGASAGPLIGLTGTTDSRLQTITLVGDSQLVAVAEGYLKQIDLRQRQVAVKVQILSVELDNDRRVDSSFSAKIGEAFLVSDRGNAYMNFGSYKPGGAAGSGIYSGNPLSFSRPGDYLPGLNEAGEIAQDAAAAAGQSFDQRNVSLRYPSNSFYEYLETVIDSVSAKVIAQPTLLVQEGQDGEVKTATSVVTEVKETIEEGVRTFSFTREDAGLLLGVNVGKIDDNGFVTLSVNPVVSIPQQAGETGGIIYYDITERSLKSGSVRLRDRQTLVLTGVIEERDVEAVSKWPILGDMPLIGQLFRSSLSARKKTELVVLVTPFIVDDESGGVYGYGYRPSTRDARQALDGFR